MQQIMIKPLLLTVCAPGPTSFLISGEPIGISKNLQASQLNNFTGKFFHMVQSRVEKNKGSVHELSDTSNSLPSHSAFCFIDYQQRNVYMYKVQSINSD